MQAAKKKPASRTRSKAKGTISRTKVQFQMPTSQPGRRAGWN